MRVDATGGTAVLLVSRQRGWVVVRADQLGVLVRPAASSAVMQVVAAGEAADVIVSHGSYPGAIPYLNDSARWSAYIRDAIVEPAIGRDILAIAPVRKPALLRQVFGVCTVSPAQIVSLQKIQGQLQDSGALETIAHYLALLEEAYLVAPLNKYAARSSRRRSAPPKLVTLSNALLPAVDPQGIPSSAHDPTRFSVWVENACLAHAWICGQRVSYWREEPYEVDGVLEGTWGSWAIEIKTGSVKTADLRGLFEFNRRHTSYRPLLICDSAALPLAERVGVEAVTWRNFLVHGLPRAVDAPEGAASSR